MFSVKMNDGIIFPFQVPRKKEKRRKVGGKTSKQTSNLDIVCNIKI